MDLTGIGLRNRIRSVVLFKLRIFELFNRVFSRLAASENRSPSASVMAPNTWGLGLGLLGMVEGLPLLWVSGRITRPEAVECDSPPSRLELDQNAAHRFASSDCLR
jgi:hypothetical protein